MPMASCTILVERLADDRYRATCHLFPDCEVIAATEETARREFEAALAALLEKNPPAREL